MEGYPGMTADELRSFARIVNSYNDMEYLLSTIIYAASPTLAGEKVSSLLSFGCSNHNLQYSWKQYKKCINRMISIDFCELEDDEKGTVVLFYNKEKLEKVLKENRNMRFLDRFGYNEEMNTEEFFMHLKERLKNSFPHEIGIFLGYPVEDVAAFIDNPDKKCRMTGYWKVYNDIEAAKHIFSKYDEIKYRVMKRIMEGVKPIDIYNMYF